MAVLPPALAQWAPVGLPARRFPPDAEGGKTATRVIRNLLHATVCTKQSMTTARHADHSPQKNSLTTAYTSSGVCVASIRRTLPLAS